MRNICDGFHCRTFPTCACMAGKNPILGLGWSVFLLFFFFFFFPLSWLVTTLYCYTIFFLFSFFSFFVFFFFFFLSFFFIYQRTIFVGPFFFLFSAPLPASCMYVLCTYDLHTLHLSPSSLFFSFVFLFFVFLYFFLAFSFFLFFSLQCNLIKKSISKAFV